MTENLLRPSFLAEAVLEIARQTGTDWAYVMASLGDARVLDDELAEEVRRVISDRAAPEKKKETQVS